MVGIFWGFSFCGHGHPVEFITKNEKKVEFQYCPVVVVHPVFGKAVRCKSVSWYRVVPSEKKN